MKTIGLALTLSLALIANSASGQTTTVRVRGTVEKLDAQTVVVKTATGASITVQLAPNFTVSAVVKKTIADIKPGSYIGAGAMPQADGTLKAIQVTIFPEAQRGVGEGHRDWSALPQTTMTNGTVADTVTSVNGPTITMNYKGGEKKLVIAADSRIISTVPATAADLKVGVEMTTTASTAADGSLSTSRVTVGRDGVEPPL